MDEKVDVDELLNPIRWCGRIQAAQKQAKDARDESRRFKRWFKGDYGINGQESKVEMNVNFVYAFVTNMMSAIYGDDPQISVHSKKPDKDQDSVNLRESINYWAYELDASKELYDFVQDHFFGCGAIETGWEFETQVKTLVAEEEMLLTKEQIEQEGILIDQEQFAKEAIAIDELGTMAILLQRGQRYKKEVIIKDQPLLKYRDFYQDIAIDPDARRLKDARWIAIRDMVTFNEFKKMNISKKKIQEVKPQVKSKYAFDLRTDDGYTFEEDSGEAIWVELWWVWDKIEKKRYLITKGYNDYLAVDDWPFEFEVKGDCWPITFLPGVEDQFGPIPYSEFCNYREQLLELNRIRTVQNSIFAKQAPKYLYNGSTATDREMRKFANAALGEAVKMRNPAGLRLAPVPEMPQQLGQWEEIIKDDLKNISGLSEIDIDKLANTATEANIIEGKQNIRKSLRARKVEATIATVFAKLGGLIQQFQTEAVTIRIQNNEDTNFLNISKEDMQGEFDYRIEPGSMQHKSKAGRLRDLLKLSESMMNDPSLNRPYVFQQIAELLNIDPQRVIVPPQPVPPEPTLEIEKIKLEDMNVVDRQRVVEEAKKQHGIKNFQNMPQGEVASLTGDNGGLNLPGGDDITTPVNPVQDASLDSFNG